MLTNLTNHAQVTNALRLSACSRGIIFRGHLEPLGMNPGVIWDTLLSLQLSPKRVSHFTFPLAFFISPMLWACMLILLRETPFGYLSNPDESRLLFLHSFHSDMLWIFTLAMPIGMQSFNFAHCSTSTLYVVDFARIDTKPSRLDISVASSETRRTSLNRTQTCS